MRRLLGICLVVMAVFGVIVANNTDAMGPPNPVQVCHVDSNVQLANGIVQFMGMVTTISASALGGHFNHGDTLLVDSNGDPLVLVDGTCCAFSVLPDGTIVPGRVD